MGGILVIPRDPVMLLSYMNTQLRDFYDSLDAFCEDKDADKGEIVEKIRSVGYEYDADKNRFV